MKQARRWKHVLAGLLAVSLVLGQISPVSAAYQTSEYDEDEANEEYDDVIWLEMDLPGQNRIIAIEEFDDTCRQVPLGSELAELNLPEQINVRQSSGADNFVASPSQARRASASDAEPTGWIEVTADWVSEPEYNGQEAGVYTFTAQLSDYELEEGVELPQITVVVGEGTAIVSFEELPEEIRSQTIYAPSQLNLPSSIQANAADGTELDVPVTWSGEPGMEGDRPQAGLYVYRAGPEGEYLTGGEVKLPVIRVMLMQRQRIAGLGTEENPLQVTSAAQLAEIGGLIADGELEAFVGRSKVYLRLEQNLDLSGYASGEGWEPIGTEDSPFEGELDGNGYVITNLVINRPGSDRQGLFGIIGPDGLVKNLGVENADVTGRDDTGAITGYAEGSVEGSYSTGSINGNNRVGGIAGSVKGSVEESYSTGAVSGNEYVGGIVGYVTAGGNVKGSYSTGDISSNNYAGGIAGCVSENGCVLNCAALNSAVMTDVSDGSPGRIAGGSPGDLNNNIAFEGMELVNGNQSKNPVSEINGRDGKSITAESIISDGMLGNRFADDTRWTAENGRLPVLVNAGDTQDGTMPEHISGYAFMGDGTETSPYLIGTAAQLKRLAGLINNEPADSQYTAAGVYYQLTADIDLSGYAGGAGWEPIGSFSTHVGFCGTFDGNGYVVKNLVINRPGKTEQGLFGVVGTGGVVKNLGVESISLIGLNHCGAIAGYASGKIEGCYSTGTVKGTGNIGGIAGSLSLYGNVEGCYSTATVSGTGEHVGGVVGYMAKSTSINQSYSTGAVTGGKHAGGVVGGIYGDENISDCVALNPSVTILSDKSNAVGRITGSDNGTFTRNMAFDGTQLFIGDNKHDAVYFTGRDGENISANDILIDAVLGEVFADETVWSFQDGKLPILTKAGESQTGTVPEHISGHAFSGEGTEASPYLIGTAAQLRRLADLVNNETTNDTYGRSYYQLTADLDLSRYADGDGWEPIGSSSQNFNGQFDGKGYVITNLVIDRQEADYQGLFGMIGASGRVKSLGVENSRVAGRDFAGGIAGSVAGSIEGSYSTGEVSGNNYAGGIAGFVAADGTVTGCYSAGEVTGSNFVGGIAGYVPADGRISNCAALNPVIAAKTGSDIGRVAAGSDGTFTNNMAFDRMQLLIDDISQNPVSDLDGKDGEGKNAETITGDGTLGGRFTEETGWETENGKLPVLKNAEVTRNGTMPEHISGYAFAGKGTEASPYQIETAAQFRRLAELINEGSADSPYTKPEACYQLTADINLFGAGPDLEPIGSDSHRFNGKFDGNGHVVKNLVIDRPTEDYQGLFGVIGDSGRLKRLVVENANVSGKDYVGAIAGYVYGSIEGSCSTGEVNGSDSVGGIAGFIGGNGVIRGSYSTGDVTGNNAVAGIAGSVTGRLEDSYSTGVVSGSDAVGGIAGEVSGGTVKNCAALNPSISVPSSDAQKGRIAGVFQAGLLSGNAAFAGMQVLVDNADEAMIPANRSDTGIQGADAYAADVADADFWDSRFGLGETSVWEIAKTGYLPTLKGLSGQNGDPGLYLSGLPSGELTISPEGETTVHLANNEESLTFRVSGWEAWKDQDITWSAESGLEITSSVNGTGVLKIPVETEPGTYIVTAKNLYSDKSVQTEVVVKKSMEADVVKIRLGKNKYVYSDQPNEPTVEVEDSGRILAKGTDYQISYQNNIAVGEAQVVVNGIGKYEDSKTVTFTIEPGEQGELKIDLEQSEVLLYDQAEILTLQTSGWERWNNKTIVWSTDSGLEVESQINGTGKLKIPADAALGQYTVTAKNEHSGQFVQSVVTVTRSLKAASLTLIIEPDIYVYTGREIRPEVVVKDSGRILVKAEDYQVSYKNNTAVGQGEVTVSGMGNYKESKTVSFMIGPMPQGELLITPKQSAVLLSDRDESLMLQTSGWEDWDDQLITWSTDTGLIVEELAEGAGELKIPADAELGTHTVTATNKHSGQYVQAVVTVTRSMKAESLTISIEPDTYTYTGKPIRANVVVKDSGHKLIEGTDYQVSYKNNTAVGQAQVIVSGMGNYGESKTVSFTIEPGEQGELNISPEQSSVLLSGQDKSLTLQTSGWEDWDDQLITWSTDHGLEVEALENGACKLKIPADAVLGKHTVTAMNEHSGQMAQAVVMVSRSLKAEALTISLEQYTYVYTDQPNTPPVEVKDSGRILRAGSDYQVSYSNNTAVGQAQVIISGIGNYKESKTVNFTIEPKLQGELTVAPEQYTVLLYDQAQSLMLQTSGWEDWSNKTIVWSTDTGLDIEVLPDGAAKLKISAGAALGKHTVTAKNEHSGQMAQAVVTVTRSLKAKALTLSPEHNTYIYTGQEIRPAVAVRDSGWLLAQGTDYQVSYSDNTQIGQGQITVTGIGDYKESKTVSFTIEPKPQGELTIEPKQSVILLYDQPESLMLQTGGWEDWNNRLIVWSTDSGLQVKALEGGKGELKIPADAVLGQHTVTAKNEYSGKTAQAVITVKRSLKAGALTISLEQDTYVYTGREIRPAVEVKDSGRLLTEGTDYQVSYQNNTQTGQGQVTVSGLGSYEESKMVSFTIKARPGGGSGGGSSSSSSTPTSRSITSNGSWQQDENGIWYCFDENGHMATGWRQSGGKWYWLDPLSGQMKVNEWIWYQDNWYYLGGDGAIYTGWLKVQDAWYYLSAEDGAYYGRMLKGTRTPDGYLVDQNGIWIKEE